MEKTTRHDRLDFDAYQAQAMTTPTPYGGGVLREQDAPRMTVGTREG